MKSTLLSSLKNKLAALVLRKDLNELTTKMDYAEYGGSVLLGLNGIVVKAHGSSNAKAFYSAIRQAKVAGELNIVDTMREKRWGQKWVKQRLFFLDKGHKK